MFTLKKIVSSIFLASFFLNIGQAQERYTRELDLRGYWKFTIGDDDQWSDPFYDDRHWEDLFVPATWEDEGFQGFDGYAWYRNQFEFNDFDQSKNYYLELGYVDDVDEVYFNGEMIGFSGSFPPRFRTSYNSLRRYYIPKELINEGINVIAVKVYDSTLDGGIVKGQIGIYSQRNIPEQTQILEGLWKFQQGDDKEWREPYYDDSNWNTTLVPGFWDGIRRQKIFDDVVWYRKQFELNEKLRNEDELVLILGKIDDFDHTYLNGQLIGFTDDGKSLGRSRSFDQYRVYTLLNPVLNRDGMNVLSVRVRDIGLDAGIYKGPIAIVPLRDFEKLIRNY